MGKGDTTDVRTFSTATLDAMTKLAKKIHTDPQRAVLLYGVQEKRLACLKEAKRSLLEDRRKAAETLAHCIYRMMAWHKGKVSHVRYWMSEYGLGEMIPPELLQATGQQKFLWTPERGAEVGPLPGPAPQGQAKPSREKGKGKGCKGKPKQS